MSFLAGPSKYKTYAVLLDALHQRDDAVHRVVLTLRPLLEHRPRGERPGRRNRIACRVRHQPRALRDPVPENNAEDRPPAFDDSVVVS